MERLGKTLAEERARLERIATAYRKLVGHVCPRYVTARNELADPALQHGIGCPICCPPDGRYCTSQPKESGDA